MAPIPPPPPLKTLPNFTELNKSTTNKANIPNTSALLKSIEKGAKLKKTVTNDRSSPLVSVQTDKSAQNRLSKDPVTSRNEQNSSNSSGSGLSGLFSNGFPTLRSTGNSVKATSPNKEGNLVPKLLKKPAEKAFQNMSNEITRDPKKSLAAVQKGSKIAKKLAVPVIITATNGHDVGSIGNSIANLAISGFKEPDKWKFPENIEKMLPVPLKYTGCEKIYLSQTNIVNSKSSKNLSGTLVSNDDIDGFIKNLKSKLSIAESEEKFEECVRLKSKLKSFDVVKKRVQLGERVYASELPR